MNKFIIGPMPPPIGGVSNHLFRYSNKYKIPVFKEKNRYSFADFLFIIKQKHTQFHIHTISWKIITFLLIKRILYNCKCKYILINHNFTIAKPKTIKEYIHFFLIQDYANHCETIYAVNVNIINSMQKTFGLKNYQLYDPFIPPDETKENEIWKSYGENVNKFLKDHDIILSSGAWHLSFHNGDDLYGFDLLIKMQAHLTQYNSKIGLIFFIGDPNYNSDYVKKCHDLISELGIQDNVFIISGQKEMWPIIKHSTIFIRATNTDGDPLSIKEAIYFGTKVIASDCCPREKSVTVFKNRDFQSLISCVKYNLEII